MAKLILIRHGESLANVANMFAGHLNVDLSEKGYRQAQMTMAYVLERYAVDRIYSSDLQRAYHTVEPAAEKLGIPVIPDKDLREIYAGDWEGAAFTVLMRKYEKEYTVWLNNIGNAAPVGGESVVQLWERVTAALSRIAAENPGKTVLIGTHATPIRSVQCHLSGYSPADMVRVPWVSNASVTVVEYPEDPTGMPRLVSAGEDAHLEALRTTFDGNV